jgi:LSD1 subclass zinc finger protein
MPAIHPCPSCEKKLKIPDGAEGKKIRCPHCKTLLLISEDGLELAEGAPAAAAAKPAAKPAKKRPVEDDEDDDRPAKKRGRDDDEEEDEDDRPRSKKKAPARDNDEDEPADDDDDDRPSRRKKKGGPSFFSKIPKWGWYAGGGGVAAILILIILFVFVLGGSDFGKIKDGMTEDEVTKILGKPNLSMSSNGKLVAGRWLKPDPLKPKEAIDISFEGGKVKKKERVTDPNTPPFWSK